MIIIALEGLDKSGKKSQADKLHKSLYERGYNVEQSEFHRYDTPTGGLIRQFLDGEYNPGQLAIECIMAADKYAQLSWFEELAEKLDVLILDRYLVSQLVYSTANGVDIDFTASLLDRMPEPNFQIFLDIEPEESMKRKGKHGENDKYESDKELLTRARDLYLRYMKLEEEDGNAMILDGTLSVEELHQQILGRTLSLLTESKEE
ncbi:TPA: dTMP kinase [Bacillus cereus]|nr:dTMP kinase [Bacillus cereus]HDR4742394.1 dTMP kinase [Bacillus cereus]HDR4747981.1 dTMP kinase [Bacillus cereus]HDR4753455.1 dTMP kinase [Bacillus cereus]HDR4770664.1 dTMP kinase [Bacillus cereus]